MRGWQQKKGKFNNLNSINNLTAINIFLKLFSLNYCLYNHRSKCKTKTLKPYQICTPTDQIFKQEAKEEKIKSSRAKIKNLFNHKKLLNQSLQLHSNCALLRHKNPSI